MDAQLVVVIAGAILFVAVIGSLLFLRGYSGKFTFDTKNGTRPRASEGEGNTAGTAFKGRFTLLTVGVGAMFTALIAKLWSMQMVSSDYYDNLSQQNRTRTVTTPAPRGRILDRNGTALVDNRASLTVTAYRDLADDAVLVRHLSNLLGIPYVAALRNIQDNTEGAQARHTVAGDVRRSTVAYLQEHAGEFSGVYVEERTERQYPYGTLAAHVLGYTSTVTQEQLDAQSEAEEAGETDAGTITYASGDTVGQAGVEARYEQLLQGIKGEQTVTVDASGNVTGQTGSVPASAGSDIRLTLDLTIQQACESGLAHAIEVAQQSGYENAGAGAVVCLDCTNGEVLGMASLPTYDPSAFVGGISSDLWNEYNSEDGGTPMLNRAISGQYMSASTIKPLSAFAGLEYGIYPATRTTNCTGWWSATGSSTDGKYCWNHSGHGVQNLQGGIGHSCDPVFYDMGNDFYYSEEHSEGLQEMYRRWGLGSSTGIDLPSEASGRVPDAAWKEEYFSNYDAADRAWVPGDMTNMVIGQGDILVTPLQMACAYAGIAMGGVQYTPHVFLSAVSRSGEGDTYLYNGTGSKERLTAHINSDADLELVKAGLHDVIYVTSSAVTAHFSSLSVEVAGKSGTGEKPPEDEYAWFCAYAPADDPKYVVSCVLEQGGGGSATALRAIRDVFGAIYNEPDTSDAADSSTR